MTQNTVSRQISVYNRSILNNSLRILTALDKDPDSKTYGSFDRDYWHYKIRDFSSMVLHQASLSLDVLLHWDHEENVYYRKSIMSDWIRASLHHWCTEQLKNGSFNEYYPFEEGYPPTAFSLYAAVLLVLEQKDHYADPVIIAHIQKACIWLLNNPERKASNQESIGLCALYLASQIEGVHVNQQQLDQRLSEFFASQDEEGWFEEYGGPDIGYLSVTLDALWDYYRYSHDTRAYEAMRKAICFIAPFISKSANLPEMINSRNTDYIVPYGLFNFCLHDKDHFHIALNLLQKITQPYNYFEATDDRYLCHYIYTSFTRAVKALADFSSVDIEKYAKNGYADERKVYDLQHCGIYIQRRETFDIYINKQKGGILYIYDKDGLVYSNFGYRFKQDKLFAVTHWLKDVQDITIEESLHAQDINISITGAFVQRGFLVPSPLKHMVLRIISFVLGNKIIPLLKKLFIFSDKTLALYCTRKITILEHELKIHDTLFTQDAQYDLSNIYCAPSYSLRHVSSAARFTPDELIDFNAGTKSLRKTKKGLEFETTIGLV
jgi:hypothetical protein